MFPLSLDDVLQMLERLSLEKYVTKFEEEEVSVVMHWNIGVH